jgi:hypothetical protein
MKKIKESLPTIGQIVILILVIFSAIYAFSNRRVEIILENSIYVSSTILLIMIVSLFIIYLRDQTIEFRKENFLKCVLGAFILGLIFYCFGTVLEDSSKYKQLEFFHYNRNWLTPLASTSTFAIAIIFFYFRLYIKSIYGLIEILLGIYIGNSNFLKNFEDKDASELYLIIMPASVYLIVRGLDNLYQAITTDSNDLITKELIKLKKQKLL